MHLLSWIWAMGKKRKKRQAEQQGNSFRWVTSQEPCWRSGKILELLKIDASQELWLVTVAFWIGLGSLKVRSLWLGVGSSGTRTWCEVVSELLVGGSNGDELERSTWGSWLQSALRGEETMGKAGFCGAVVVVTSQKLGGRVRWFSGRIWSQKCIMGDRDYTIGTTLSNSQTWTFTFHVIL